MPSGAGKKHRRGASLSGGGGWGVGKKKDKKGSEGDKAAAPGLIVFVIGGICHEEIQSVHELVNKHKVDVYLGSTHMTNPELFVEKGLKNKDPTGKSRPF